MSEEMHEGVKQMRGEQLLTGRDVAQILNVSRSFAYQLMREGTLPTVRLGRVVRVRYEDLMIFINENIDSAQ